MQKYSERENLIRLVKFALKHKGKWHSFAPNAQTTRAICAASNASLVEVNKFSQFKAREENARRYLC